MGYLDQLLDEESRTGTAQSGYLNGLMDAEVTGHFEETGEISLRPGMMGKRLKKFTGKGGSGASFVTHLKAGYKYDPITKAEVYAAARFPNLSEDERLSRYQYRNGEFIYQADNGDWYSESPDLFHQKAKAILGGTHWEPVVGGVLGELFGGHLLGMGGAAGGEALHQLIAEAGGTKISGTQKAVDIGLEGATSLIGGTGGGAGVKGTRKVLAAGGGRKGLKIAKAAGKDLPYIDFKEAVRLRNYYKKNHGVDLFDAQTTESRRLLDKVNLFRDMPETADLINSAKKIQDEQAFNAAERYFDDIAPFVHPSDVGEDLTKAAKQSIQKDVNAMVARAKPLYRKAKASKVEVDIVPHLQKLDEEILETLEGSAQRNHLKRIRRLLFRTEKVGKKEMLVPISSTRDIDKFKKTVDVFLDPKKNKTPIDRETADWIRTFKNNVLTDLDDANPAYKKARRIWGEDAEAIDKLTRKTKLKQIASLEGDQNFMNATRQLFANNSTDPKIMKGIRDRIVKENPELWDQAVRVRLADIFESTKGSAKGSAEHSAKVFGGFWRNTVGDPKQHKILASAMGVDTTKPIKTWYSQSKQYAAFSDITDLMRRVSLIVRTESTTAIRQQSIKEEQPGMAKSFFKAYAYPLVTPTKILYDKLTQFQTSRGRKLMAEALTDPKAQGYVLKIRKMGPGTEAGIKATSTFFSLVLGGEFRRHGKSRYIDQPDEMITNKQYPLIKSH